MPRPQAAHGPLRSYGRVQSRPVKAKQKALFDSLLPAIAIPDPAAGPLDPRMLMPTADDVWLEIGFGGGEHMAAQAQAHPTVLFIGAEPFVNGVGSCLRHLDEGGITNVRLHHGDAREVLWALPDVCASRVYILFPDPWPKARHHKRRIIQDEVIADLARVVKPGGLVRFATDWADYVDWTLERFAGSDAFRFNGGRDAWNDHVPTRYEQKRLGDCDPVFLEFLRP